MYASVKERNGSVSSRIRRDERKNARVPMKRFAREKKEYDALWKRYIAYKTSTTTHVDDQTQQLVDFRLERERFGFFFSRHDDSSNSVCVFCALCNGVQISPQERDGEKTII